MKTTIELPDELFAEAKAVAHARGTTLKQLVTAGLRAELGRRSDDTRADFVFPTYGDPGGGWPDLTGDAFYEAAYGDRA